MACSLLIFLTENRSDDWRTRIHLAEAALLLFNTLLLLSPSLFLMYSVVAVVSLSHSALNATLLCQYACV